MAYVRVKRRTDGTVRYAARYLGADGRYHEEGAFASRREAEKAGVAREIDAVRGDWTSPLAARTLFADYVETAYWPSTAHLEVSTRVAYRYTLDRHFLPRFGHLQMRRISPSVVQAWVNDATKTKLSARTVVKYHMLLHRIFARAVIDRAVAANPCAYTELPKVIVKPKRIITVEQFDAILAGIPARYRTMVLLAIETGLRWGELVALRPVDIDFASRVIHVRRTIVEVARKNSPTGQRCFVKEYPKDDEPRRVQIEPATCALIRAHMVEHGIRDTDLLFTSKAKTMISRNNFRTKYWRPAVEAANTNKSVTFHNLRAAHASWLLAGGADLQTVKERLGHTQISTTQQYLGTLPDAGDRALAAFRKTRGQR
jgi:integrase